MKTVLWCIVALYAICQANATEIWKTEGFENFRMGTVGNAGQNIYISKSGYDGVIVENDTGSFGRRVKSIIALNSNQLKNTDNLTPTADDDIRYSLDIRQRILQQTAKADNIKNRAVSDFTRQVRDIFGIDSSVSADIKTAVQDMATEVLDNGYVSPASANRLFEKAVRLGSEIDDNYRYEK